MRKKSGKVGAVEGIGWSLIEWLEIVIFQKSFYDEDNLPELF